MANKTFMHKVSLSILYVPSESGEKQKKKSLPLLFFCTFHLFAAVIFFFALWKRIDFICIADEVYSDAQCTA